MGRVQGRVALITGAARGQGRSHAVRLAEEGADIIAIDLCDQVGTVHYDMPTATDLAETKELVEATGRRVITAAADVRDTAVLRTVVEQSVAEARPARHPGRQRRHLQLRPGPRAVRGGVADVIDINLTGVWRTCVAAIPSMIAAGHGGSVILTSSVAGLTAFRNTADYVTSKYGVVGLMKCLALELGEHGIRVNSVNPTGVSTPMLINEPTFKLFLPDSAEPDGRGVRRRTRRAGTCCRCPCGRQ